MSCHGTGCDTRQGCPDCEIPVWIFNDGGRHAAGFKGTAGDCVCRAIAIAAERPYSEIYDLINQVSAEYERKGKRKRNKSSARKGVYKTTLHIVLDWLGFVWSPTMSIGSGCKTHLRADELPAGRLVVALSKHACAVVDGVIHDINDPSRGGTRCVYGYWSRP